MNKFYKKVIPILFIGSFLFMGAFLVFSSISAQTSTDAIGFRIVKNTEHYSAMRWYTEQGFTGSPQSLMVDGYEAVRDGRTVYVNAANIFENNLYTNINLISYNQGAEKETEDMFAQILKHWKFNTDLDGAGECVGLDEDGENCTLDEDCRFGEHCTSEKAQVRRDVRRMADLSEMDVALKGYNDNNGRYPVLGAGTYLSEKTISTWPSWEETLTEELGTSIPKDPINKMGDCLNENYDPETCWNEDEKSFDDRDPDPDVLALPDDSYTYVYSSENDGESYKVCALMETDYVQAEDRQCREDVIINKAPVIICDTMTGSVGKEFRGTVSAYDPDGGELIWSMTGVWGSWSPAPRLIDTGSTNQRVIYSSNAVLGTFIANIQVEDARQSIVSKNCQINIINRPPVIMNNPCYYLFQIGEQGEYRIKVVDPDGHNTSLSMSGSLPSGLELNNYTISGIPTASGETTVTMIARDSYDLSTTKQCSIRVGCRPDCSCAIGICSSDPPCSDTCGGTCVGRVDCTPPPAPDEYCGDGIVNLSETCNSCPEDVGECPLVDVECNDSCSLDEECLTGYCYFDEGYFPMCRERECPEYENCICPVPCDWTSFSSSCSGCAPNQEYRVAIGNSSENPSGCIPHGRCVSNCECNHSCEPEPEEPVCGNGDIEEGEECDDNNTINNDGCRSDCTKPECDEPCTAIGCGDGLTCSDDGRCRNSGCFGESDCICEDCGNGTCDAGENCDNCPDDCTVGCPCIFDVSQFDNCVFGL